MKINTNPDTISISTVVVERIRELLDKKNMTVSQLSIQSGVTQSTVNDVYNYKYKNIGIITIKRLCDGLEINITEFFDTSNFKNLKEEP